MRIILFILSALFTMALIIALNFKWGSLPPLGKFLSPQQGFWQNAEAVHFNYNQHLAFKKVKGKVEVYIDDRLVPHVFAESDEDAYFVEGYLHAKFRLWQMDFQTMAAAGRISEFLGPDERFIKYDREQRRLGMVYGAENAVNAMEADNATKKVIDAYTAGVNAYIASLTESGLPVEYKLLDYKPEQWSNLKIALFIKLMSSDLAGQSYGKDLQFTNAKTVFSDREINILYPELSDSSIPIIPKGTAFEKPSKVPLTPAHVDSLYFGKDTTVKPVPTQKPIRLNGSNNWAVSGKKTESGAPILCNDPHLRLSLPSVWFEMQIKTPTMNVYGVTFPSIPGVVIGFNDSIAFGFTNAGRDVMDYYKIRFKDSSRQQYWYNGKWETAKQRIEQIKVKNGFNVSDTVSYTVFGPVIYDRSFTAGDTISNTALAVRWIAHDPSNEILTWLKLDRAQNYTQYASAIREFSCPAQNMLFASKSGDIALWQQAKFPARWTGQGLYVMPGEDSSFQWQGYIPRNENPHVLNPESGYIQSANQRPVDSSYPYFIPGDYFESRGIAIDRSLKHMQHITVQDMMRLQSSVYDDFAADAVPLLLKHVDTKELTEKQKEYVHWLQQWDFNTTADSKATTVFRAWWDSLEANIWMDEFGRLKQKILLPDASAWNDNTTGSQLITIPDEQTLLEALLKDSTFKYIDNIYTDSVESLRQQVTRSLQQASGPLQKEETQNDLVWWKHRNTSILHLLRSSVLPFARTNLAVGGWRFAISALTRTHGPSWRMIVQLSNPTVAYGVYPGGQSGNPGSRFYDLFINTWAANKYYTLWVMNENQKKDKRIKWKMTFAHS